MDEYGWAIGIGILIIAAQLGRALGAVLRAHAGRINRSGVEPQDAHVSQALQDVQKRVGELEERLDFAERLLSKQREAERVAPPKL